MPAIRQCTRLDDMHPRRGIRVSQDQDGDVHIAILQDGDILLGCDQNGDLIASKAEFVLGGGGGRSPHTTNALRELMDAIDRDNAELLIT